LGIGKALHFVDDSQPAISPTAEGQKKQSKIYLRGTKALPQEFSARGFPGPGFGALNLNRPIAIC
jgi:hypothetical protein